VYTDPRGFFLEAYNRRTCHEFPWLPPDLVQDNHSRSVKGVLRGLHYQLPRPQGKLVRVARGAIYDVAVDLRRRSPTFGRWAAVRLDDSHHQQLWVPPGFAHGFLVLSDVADVLYKTSEYYYPQNERSLLWSDSELAIPWPLDGVPTLSAKDAAAAPLAEIAVYEEMEP
jgi:dTDP-4-dehydrorhamnose 3,5-epimerase